MEGNRRRRRSAAQATIEFAFIAPLFFVCFLATIDAGLWAVQNSAEVAAVEQAVRLAATAGSAPVGGVAPDARMITRAISAHLGQALFATSIAPWCDPAPGAPCGHRACPGSPAAVEAALGPRVVTLCVEEHAPACVAAPDPTSPLYCSDTPTVTVRLIGFTASLVPPGFGFGGSGGEIATDLSATTHTLRFAP